MRYSVQSSLTSLAIVMQIGRFISRFRSTSAFVAPSSIFLPTRSTTIYSSSTVRYDQRTKNTLWMSTTESSSLSQELPHHAKKAKNEASATARSRAPFGAPSSAFDDSIPQLTKNRNNDDDEGAFEIDATPDLAWSRLGLSPEIANLLTDSVTNGGMEFIGGPTPVQRMAIPAILSGYANELANFGFSNNKADDETSSKMQSITFAAATGSGKTLAYLLPIIQLLKSQELLIQTSSSTPSLALNQLRSKPKRPRALILAPTRELATQISVVLKSLSHKVKLSTQVIVGGEDYGKQRKKLNRPLDVLVSTPGRLMKHWKDGNVHLGSLNFIVVDEVDTMMEQGFQGDVGHVLHPLLYKHKGPFLTSEVNTDMKVVKGAPQLIMTSATMTNAVKRLLKDESAPPKKRNNASSANNNNEDKIQIVLPSNMRVLTAPGLHRAVPRLRQVFIDVGNVDKLSLLVDVISAEASKMKTNKKRQGGEGLTLVFCNTVGSCRAAQHALAESGIESLCYHGELNSAARAENLAIFRKAGKVGDSSQKVPTPRSSSRDDVDFDDEEEEYNLNETTDKKDLPRVLVCTDIAARGLDVPEVNHVLMFDFPLNPIDYLHRAGRTARGLVSSDEGKGLVSALVAKRDRVLAMAIEGAVQRGEPLDGLSSRKTDYLPGGRLGNRDLGGSYGSKSNGNGGSSKSRRNSYGSRSQFSGRRSNRSGGGGGGRRKKRP